jgi:hypothetical protein
VALDTQSCIARSFESVLPPESLMARIVGLAASLPMTIPHRFGKRVLPPGVPSDHLGVSGLGTAANSQISGSDG